MLSFVRSTAIALPLLLACGLASPAMADDMFGGFFNRLIPGSSAPAATPQPPPPPPVIVAKAPLTGPDAAPTESNPFNEGSGGLMNAMRGYDAGCSGILCNFMGGERPPSAPGRPGPSPATRAQIDAQLDAIDAAPEPRTRRHADGTPVPPPEHRCTDTTDPWRCYR